MNNRNVPTNVETIRDPRRGAVDEELADVDQESHDRAVFDEFDAAATRVTGIILRKVEAARREHAEFCFGPDYKQEIEDLKSNKASILKVISALEGLKKALNLRMDDLKWFRDRLDPSRDDFDDY